MRLDDAGLGDQVEEVSSVVFVQARKLHAADELSLKHLQFSFQPVQGVVPKSVQVVAVEFGEQRFSAPQVRAMAREQAP